MNNDNINTDIIIFKITIIKNIIFSKTNLLHFKKCLKFELKEKLLKNKYK